MLLGPNKSIAGFGIVTSSQIQDGGQPLVCRGISVINDLMLTNFATPNQPVTLSDKTVLTKVQVFKFKMADGRHTGKYRYRLYSVA